MPSLYGFTGNNSNVSVGNTTGLYIGSGNVNILNNAGTLLSLLSNAGTVGFTLTNTGRQVEGIVLPSGVTAGTYGSSILVPQLTIGSDGRITSVNNVSISIPPTYSNVNVAAYIPTDPTIQSMNANLTVFKNYANVTYATNANLASTNANLAAFETYANATFGTSSYGNSNVAAYIAANTDPTISNLNANTHQVQTQIASINSNVQTLSANVGAFETFSNANTAGLYNSILGANVSIQTLSANVGAFETFSNANTAGLYNSILGANASIQTLNANVGSFYTYANLTYSTIANAASQESEITNLRANITAANLNIQTLSANLGSFETYANATFVTTANASTYSNTNVSAYLSSGLVSTINTSANITTTANVVASGNFYGNLIAANIIVANIGIQNYTSYGSVGTPAYGAGVLWYDSIQDSIAYYSSVTNNEVNVGQELQFNAYNGTGSQINQGVPVYLTGGSFNNLPNIAPAIANTISTSQVAGVANQNIPNNTIGCVVTIGIVANVAMGTFSVGDTLYLSPYSAGQVSNTQPPTGFVVKVGTVLYNNSPNGRFLVNKTVPVNNQYYGNLTITGTTTTGNLTTTNGVYWANGVSYGSTFASSYGNANVASYLASGTDATINNINANLTAFENYANVTYLTIANASTYSNSNVASYLSSNTDPTISNLNANTAQQQTQISALQVAPIFMGNLKGNVLYDSVFYRANIQAYPINYIQNSTTSYYQTSFLNSSNPVYDASNLLYANATVSGTTQANVTLRTTASPPQQTFGFQEQFQVFAANTSMVNGDRVRGMGSSIEIFTKPNGATNGVWGPYVALSNNAYPTFAQQNGAATPAIAAHQAYAGISGTGNVYTAAGLFVVSTLNPSNGSINMNIQQGVNVSMGWVGAIGQTTQTSSKIDVVRAFSVNVTKLGSNAAIANTQTVVHAQGLYLQANWHTSGNVGFLPTGTIRSVQSEDPLTELYNAGNVIIGGNLIQTGSANTVTFSGPTIVNNSVTINGATSLLQVTTYTVTALNAITGVSGQVAAVSNGTAKNGGQLAYWDTTNARWSWFDTNLAVS